MLRRLIALPCLTLFLFVLYGCGSDNREVSDGGTGSYKESSACIGCHSGRISPVTQNLIVFEWISSAHNLKSGAACTNCHDSLGHPNGPIVSNPANTVCLRCHTQSTMKTGAAHFEGSAKFVAGKAAYVSVNPLDPGGLQQCQKCHNPHDVTALLPINQQWAASGHGDITAPPWTEYKWKQPARSNPCQRCHTATGYRYYMTNGLAIPGRSFFGQYTSGREVLMCNGCHTDYSWKRLSSDDRNTAPSFAIFSTPYQTNLANPARTEIPRTFPNNPANPITYIGDSSLCLPCHSGLTSGENIRGNARSTTTAVANFTDVGFTNPHYLGAAAMLYQKAGFRFYTSPLRYLNNPNGAGTTSTNQKYSFSHSNVGVNNFVTTQGFNTGNDGPCVTCHMKSSKGHTWSPIETWNENNGCWGCHTEFTAEGGVAKVIEEEQELMNTALDFLLFELNNSGIYYSETYPYFFKSAGNTTAANQLRDWAAVGPQMRTPRVDGPLNNTGVSSGTNNMGAAFNFKMIKAEKGSHVHNRGYARKLIFDSIQYVQKADLLANRSLTTTNANDYINFVPYSTAKAAGSRTASPKSISQLKGYIFRIQNGRYTFR